MFAKSQYLNLAGLAALMVILVLSSMGAERYNKNREDDRRMMTFSVVGIIFSLFGIIGLGMYIKSGGRQAIVLANDRYA